MTRRRHLAAETARIGAAEAERFPRLTISGQFALSGSDIGDVVNPDARAFNLGPTITLPVLNGGRIDANIDLAESNARGKEAPHGSSSLKPHPARCERPHKKNRPRMCLARAVRIGCLGRSE